MTAGASTVPAADKSASVRNNTDSRRRGSPCSFPAWPALFFVVALLAFIGGLVVTGEIMSRQASLICRHLDAQL